MNGMEEKDVEDREDKGTIQHPLRIWLAKVSEVSSHRIGGRFNRVPVEDMAG